MWYVDLETIKIIRLITKQFKLILIYKFLYINVHFICITKQVLVLGNELLQVKDVYVRRLKCDSFCSTSQPFGITNITFLKDTDGSQGEDNSNVILSQDENSGPCVDWLLFRFYEEVAGTLAIQHCRDFKTLFLAPQCILQI